MKRPLAPIVFPLLVILCSVLIGTLFYFHPKSRDYREIKEEGVIRIVTEYDPYGYYVSGDSVDGFQYALSRAISHRSGLNVEIHLETSLAKSFEKLSRGEYDIISRNIPVTSELKQKYLFTRPIVYNKQVLVQRTAESNKGTEPIRNQLDLAKKTLYIPEESPARLRIENLEHEIGDTIYVIEDPLYSSEQLMMMVAKGDIDYAVCDRQLAVLLQKQLPELDIQTDISFTQLQCWALRKDSPVLRDSLDHWMGEIRQSGLFNRIYHKYYRKR